MLVSCHSSSDAKKEAKNRKGNQPNAVDSGTIHVEIPAESVELDLTQTDSSGVGGGIPQPPATEDQMSPSLTTDEENSNPQTNPGAPDSLQTDVPIDSSPKGQPKESALEPLAEDGLSLTPEAPITAAYEQDAQDGPLSDGQPEALRDESEPQADNGEPDSRQTQPPESNAAYQDDQNGTQPEAMSGGHQNISVDSHEHNQLISPEEEAEQAAEQRRQAAQEQIEADKRLEEERRQKEKEAEQAFIEAQNKQRIQQEKAAAEAAKRKEQEQKKAKLKAEKEAQQKRQQEKEEQEKRDREQAEKNERAQKEAKEREAKEREAKEREAKEREAKAERERLAKEKAAKEKENENRKNSKAKPKQGQSEQKPKTDAGQRNNQRQNSNLRDAQESHETPKQTQDAPLPQTGNPPQALVPEESHKPVEIPPVDKPFEEPKIDLSQLPADAIETSLINPTSKNEAAAAEILSPQPDLAILILDTTYHSAKLLFSSNPYILLFLLACFSLKILFGLVDLLVSALASDEISADRIVRFFSIIKKDLEEGAKSLKCLKLSPPADTLSTAQKPTDSAAFASLTKKIERLNSALKEIVADYKKYCPLFEKPD